ncbi:MAG: hypothetical protein H0V33_07295 [Acidimicrobiia bacterium]|nr:hypothetical protein [Acidimicrobiia bacterium]
MTVTALPAPDPGPPAGPDPLLVRPWPDPVLDELGHDPRSSYCERFWLPLLGPSATLLARRLAEELEAAPDGFDLPLADGARSLGLGVKGGRHGPFVRTVGRLVAFRLAHLDPRDGVLLTRRKLAPLTRVQIEKLPRPLRDEHAEWQAHDRRTPDVERLRRRSRQLALSLLECGESRDEAERQLHRWRYHPALTRESVTWAWERHCTALAAAGPPPGHRGAPDHPDGWSTAPRLQPRPTGVPPTTATGGAEHPAPDADRGALDHPDGWPPTPRTTTGPTGVQPTTRTGGAEHLGPDADGAA